MGDEDRETPAPAVPGDRLSPSEADATPRVTARERRAQRVQTQRRRELPGTIAKNVAIGVGALVVLGGGVWALTEIIDLSGAECEWHEHATFKVFIRGEPLSFKHAKFDMERPGGSGLLPMRAHLHQPNDSQIHLEGDCASVSDFFGFMQMELEPGYLRLDPYAHDAEAYRDEGNETLRFFLFHPGGNADEGNWTETPEVVDYQLRNFERLLVTFGNLTTDEIVRQQAQVPPPPSS